MAEATWRRQARYYLLAVVSKGHAAVRQRGAATWLAGMTAKHGNLRAALNWSLEQGEAETAQRLAGGLWFFWYLQGHLSEGRRWLERALALPGVVPAAVRATALQGVGALVGAQGDYPQGRGLWEGSLTLYREIGDTAQVARL
jgi:ABC-type Fe3+ transport system permease subunit